MRFFQQQILSICIESLNLSEWKWSSWPEKSAMCIYWQPIFSAPSQFSPRSYPKLKIGQWEKQSGCGRGKSWLCVLAGRRGVTRQEEGQGGLGNLPQQWSIPPWAAHCTPCTLHTAVQAPHHHRAVQPYSRTVVNLCSRKLCAAEYLDEELCSAVILLCQFWHRFCLALINTCWQGGGDDQGIRDTDKPSWSSTPPTPPHIYGGDLELGADDTDKLQKQ